jgi:hypothetical protein
MSHLAKHVKSLYWVFLEVEYHVNNALSEVELEMVIQKADTWPRA